MILYEIKMITKLNLSFKMLNFTNLIQKINKKSNN